MDKFYIITIDKFFRLHQYKITCNSGIGVRMTLTDGQATACEKLDIWMSKMDEYDIFRIHGYAGTGKTTVISHYIKENPFDPKRIIFVTPTNKAKRVLASKLARDGLDRYRLGTVFSLLYTWIDNAQYIDAIEMAQVFHEKQKTQELTDDEEETFRKLCRLTRELEPNISAPRERPDDLDLIIIDEASMVGRKDSELLMSWGIPMVVIGDPFQLPPVKESDSLLIGTYYDALITEVVRTDSENKALKLATDLRNDQPFHPSLNRGYAKESLTISYSRDLERMKKSDCVIAFTNSMVAKVNQEIHDSLFPENKELNFPQIGEPLMFYQGNYKKEKQLDENGKVVTVTRFNEVTGQPYAEPKTTRKTLFDNGERVILESDAGPRMSLRKDDGSFEVFDKYDTRAFHDFLAGLQSVNMREITKWYLTYGYACTVHKSQGSEFDHVYIVNDYPLYMRNTITYRRWLYTAITRAKKSVFIEGGI